MTNNDLASSQPIYLDPSRPVSERVSDLIARLTLEEKIGQMTQVEKQSIDPKTAARLCIGSILSGGGGNPNPNSPATWLEMVSGYLDATKYSRLGIPPIYGVDAVHGHNNVYGATIFPHNSGLGATRDADLVRRIGRATAVEVYATGVRWNFAPCIAVPQDFRWGRVYEGFAEDVDLVSRLGVAYIEGLQSEDWAAPFAVMATAKHYVGDGGAAWGTSTTVIPAIPQLGVNEATRFMIDQGDTQLDEATFRAIHLAPYVEAINAGAQTVMASFSAWNGEKLHGHHYLLTEVLKDELDFTGFVVSDWKGIYDYAEDTYQATVACINAGIDMSMVPYDYERFISETKLAVEQGDIPLARIDDAVRRILTVKMNAGLFEHPAADGRHLELIGCQEHRALAREAAARSVVLLKNEDQILPLSKEQSRLLVAGRWADDIGYQCGGWTVAWLGGSGKVVPGTSLLEAIRATVADTTVVDFDPSGHFADAGDDEAEFGLVFLGERPYAEGFGDRADLALDAADIAVLERMRRRCKKLIVVLVTGRPLIITGQLPLIDALVVAWLPGSEGQGVTDVLFGDVPFGGKLPYTWPRDMSQIPFDSSDKGDPLFPFGFGL